jgi:hypothetical protein
MNATLPAAPAGKSWSLVADTSEAAEAWGSWQSTSTTASSAIYAVGRRSIALFVAR